MIVKRIAARRQRVFILWHECVEDALDRGKA